MPKQRQTCTRCSQRRQKCDRKAPCTRCVQNNEGHLCTTKWVNGYNPNVHRKYPRKLSEAGSSDTSTSGPSPDANAQIALPPIHPQTAGSQSGRNEPHEEAVWRTGLPDMTISAILEEKDADANQSRFDKSFSYARSKRSPRDGPNGSTSIASCYSAAARIVETQYLQSILPPREKLMLIVEYYEQYMMYWHGGIYHGPSFRKKLLQAYGQSCELALQDLDWTWVALLCKFTSISNDAGLPYLICHQCEGYGDQTQSSRSILKLLIPIL